MSDLTRFRDHCRAMAEPPKQPTQLGGWCSTFSWAAADHPRCTTPLCLCHCHPRNAPPTGAERDLFRRLADEVDAYLAHDPDVVLTGPGDDDEPFDLGLIDTTRAAQAATTEEAPK